jgi:DNA-binding transcriptional MocR family regulator
MPGRDELVKALGVSGKTVELALDLLEKEGLLVSQGPGRRRRISLAGAGGETLSEFMLERALVRALPARGISLDSSTVKVSRADSNMT